MEKEPPSDLPHANLNYQNNSFNHSNSISLNQSFSNSGDRPPIQETYTGSSQQSPHVLPNRNIDSVHGNRDGAGSLIIPGCSSISPRQTTAQGSVHMTAQVPQGSSSYSVPNKPLPQTHYNESVSNISTGQGAATTSYAVHASLQGPPTSVPRFNAAGYANSTHPTSSNPPNAGASTASDHEKRHLIQQQLFLLLHAQSCQREQNQSTPCSTPHCRMMRGVLVHMNNCSEGKNCRKPHCASSRQIISHWKNCSSTECPVCGPLRRKHQQRGAIQRQPGQIRPDSAQAAEVNGVSPSQTGSSLRSPAPQNVRNFQMASSTSTPQIRVSGNYSQSTPVQSVASNPPRSGNDGAETNWRDGVSVEHRDHVVRRIVKYILPQPDPAAYSDPRMANLIEYAKKVESAMYATANNKQEYFQLLSERCYKIYKELEEARRRRKGASSTSGNGSTSVPGDSSASLGSAANTSMSAIEAGTGSNRGSLASDGRATSNVSDFKPEVDSKEGIGNTKCEDVKPTTSDLMSSNTSVNSTPKIQIKSENPAQQSVDSISTTGALVASGSVEGIKVDQSKWKKWSREELLRHFNRLHENICEDKNAEWFREPVDPVALNIPDYPEVIKHPMDLSTIRNNLEDGVYKDPWQVLDHYRLMFNNAWLYNKKNSKVYKMCTKLSELFESQVDQVMQGMGFCCGHEYSYQQILYCSSANVCTIGKDAFYYMYANNDKSVLACDNYYQCEKCFNEAGEEILIADEANQPPVPIKKDRWERKRNNVTIQELDVHCKECGRRWHKVCALHMDEIWPSGFVCPGCLRERGQRRRENRFTAKNLPTNKLSNFLERRVNNFLKKKDVGTGDVTIRVLASSDKTVEVKPLMRARFTESGELSESFPYRLKAIFAFQEIDGQDVCFFGLYIQEYGSESPQPNRRRVYVAYLDSVFYFRPKQYRTDVYHEILVGYLHFAKNMGYTMAHIWACPPAEGDDYIFHMHPIEQRIPKAKRLQEWYKKMLQKAMIEGIVADFKDILRDAIDHHLVSPTEIPYFEGDFWPNTLEEILQDLDKEEERRRREALAETEDDDLDGSRDRDGDHGDLDKRSGKKRAKKRKCSKKAGGSLAKRKKPDGPVDCNTELTRKVYDTMEKLKEIFFVIRLHKHGATSSLPPINDQDPLISSELMESRDSFLQMAREKHLEFSSLRRAKYSTLVMLYELHNEGKQTFLYTCNVCKDQIETRWHCNECEEYDLCNRCYKRENHPHPMEQCGLGIEEEGGNTNGDSSVERSTGNAGKKPSLVSCISALVHAHGCRDANCPIASCVKMKKVLHHFFACSKRTNGECTLCRQLIHMCCLHAKSCTEVNCRVPLCPHLKGKLRQQQIQKRRQQNKSLQRRTNLTRGATEAPGGVSAYHPQCSSQPNTSMQSSSGNADVAYGGSSMADGRRMSRTLSTGSMDGVKGVLGVQNISVNGGATVGASSQRAIASPKFTSQVQGQTTRLPTSASQVPWRGDGQPLSGQQAPLQQQQQQPQSVTAPFRSPDGAAGGGGSVGSLASSESATVVPTQAQIDQVLQVMDLIRKTDATAESKNEHFQGWMNRHPDLKPAFEEIRRRKRPFANQRLLAQQAVAAGVGQHQVQGATQSQGSAVIQSSSPVVASTSAMVSSRPVAITTVGASQYQFAQQPMQGQFTQMSEQQQFVIAQPMRVRALPGGSAVIQPQQQVQPKPHQSDQQWLVARVRPGLGQTQQHQGQMYTKSSPGGVQAPVVYTATGGTGTTLLTTTIGGNVGNSHHHPQQPQIVSHSTRLVPSMNSSGGTGQRVLGSSSPSTAAVLQLRTASTQQHQQPLHPGQQHILVANPAVSNPQQQPQRPIVTVMQQPSPTKNPSIAQQPPQGMKLQQQQPPPPQQQPSQNPLPSNNPTGS